MVGAIFLCGGSGRRMGGAVPDKVRAVVAGKPVWQHSLDAFKQANLLDRVIWVTRDKEQERAIRAVLDTRADVPWEQFWVQGGAERRDSVFAGLSALPFPTEVVFVHDMARPCIHPDILPELLETAGADGAAILAHRVTDTIRQGPPDGSRPRHCRLQTLDRQSLWAMETPQVFRMELLLPAYQDVIRNHIPITDDAAAFEYRNLPITLVENPDPNPKLTRPGDLAYIDHLLRNRLARPQSPQS